MSRLYVHCLPCLTLSFLKYTKWSSLDLCCKIIVVCYMCSPTRYTTFVMVGIFIHNMLDSSTCFGPTGPSSGASINCVLLVWYVKTVCCLVRPYVRWLWNNHLTYGRRHHQIIQVLEMLIQMILIWDICWQMSLMTIGTEKLYLYVICVLVLLISVLLVYCTWVLIIVSEVKR